VVRIIFSLQSWFEVFTETPVGKLIEANRHARLFCSKLLLDDVIFIRLSDKSYEHYTETFTE